MTSQGTGSARAILYFEGDARRAYWRRFSALLTISVIIATMGLLRDSGAVVIAAMLVAPLMTPILGVAASIMTGRTRRTLVTLGIIALAVIWSVILSWIMMFVANVPRGLQIPHEVAARTHPGVEELIVALAAGAAGAYVQLNRAELSLIPGAAIGVALVPPLSAAGMLIYFADPRGALDAFLLFATNLAAIILSACLVFLLTGSVATVHGLRRRIAKLTLSSAIIIAMMVLVTVKLGQETYHRFSELRLEEATAKVLTGWSAGHSVEIIRLDVEYDRKLADVWLIVDLPIWRAGSDDAPLLQIPERLRDGSLEAALNAALGPEFSISVRFQTRFSGTLVTGDGPLDPVILADEFTKDEN